MMMRMGAVTQDTIVVTTVHDCQIFDSLPPQIFKEYDVPVDIIVTPTQTIIVNPKLKKPSCIMWHILSERRIKSMPVLQQLREMDEKYALKYIIVVICFCTDSCAFSREGKILNSCAFFREGKIVTSKEEDSDIETQKTYCSNYVKNKKRFKTKKIVSNDNNIGEEEEKQVKTRFLKKRTFNKVNSRDNSVFSNVAEVRNIVIICMYKIYTYTFILTF